MKYLLPPFLLSFLMLTGCSENRQHVTYDGKKLLEQKCASCHNLDMPPETTADEPAPPMMAVTFHVTDYMEVGNPAEKRGKFIAFVTDYARFPSAEKSFCDKESLKSYGLMPSQKGKISEEELEAVAAYMFDHYTKEHFLTKMQEAAAFARLSPGEQLARRTSCFGCHDLTQQKVGPSFTAIAERYDTAGPIIASIRDGSRSKWEQSRNIPMPAIRELNASQTKRVAEWILTLKK